MATSTTLAISVGCAAYHRNRDGLFFWAIALTLHTIAYVLFDLRGQINNFTSIAVANGMLAGSFAMFAESLFQFQQRASPRWLIWLPVLFITVSFVFLLDQPHMRIFLSGIIYSFQGLILFVPLRQKRRETTGRGQYFLATGLALVIAIFLLRAVGAATGVVDINSLTTSNSVQAGTYLSSLISMVLLSLGFLLMTKERADERNYLLAHDVVARHMLGTDRKFFPYLEAPSSR